MCSGSSTCGRLTTQQSACGGIGSRVHKGTALGEPVESLYRPSCMTVRVAEREQRRNRSPRGIDRLTLIAFLVIPPSRFCCVVEDRWQKPEFVHERCAFILFWNSSRVIADSGSLRKAAQRSSNNFCSGSETSKLSNSGAIDSHNSSTSSSFCLTGKS